MLSRNLHSLALALLLSTLALILSGAMQLGQPVGEPHRGLSGLVAILAIAILAGTASHARLRTLALGCVLSVFALGGLGFVLARSPWAVVAHACLSHVFFAGTVALWMGSAPAAQSVETLPDTGSPSLRTLSQVAPAAVMVQIFLGAIYRHLSWPVWPHLVGSLLVACLLLYTGMVVLEADGSPKDLRLAAQVLIGFTIAQMAFGLGAFLGRVMASDGLPPEWWMIASRTIHVLTGALTLGATVAYAMQVFNHVQPGDRRHPIDVDNNRIGESVVA